MQLLDRCLSALTPHPLSNEVFGQLSDDRLQDLLEDIRDRGLQYPLEVDLQDRVICGSQRYRCLVKLQWEQVPCIVRDELTSEAMIREHLLKDNILRRQLTPGQLYKAGKALEGIYSEQAAARRLSNLATVPVEPLGEQGQTRDKVAREIGTSGTGYQRLKTVFESDDEVLKLKVDRGEVAVSAAAHQLQRRRSFQAERMATQDARSKALRFIKFLHQLGKFQQWLVRYKLQVEGEQRQAAAKELEKTAQIIQNTLQKL